MTWFKVTDGGVACYIRDYICFNMKTCLPINMEYIFTDLFPKTKPITIGGTYKPPNQTRLFEQIITQFEATDLKNKLYILRDFNMNLLSKGKYILDKPKEIRKFYKRIFIVH